MKKKKQTLDPKLLVILGVIILGACSLVPQPGAEATPTAPPSNTPFPTRTVPPTWTPVPPTETPTRVPTETITPTPPPVTPNAASLPDPDGFWWLPFGPLMKEPLGLTFAPDGTNRIFVIEKAGQIWILEDRERHPLPFLDISQKVSSVAFERGLLGLAFHPRYAENGYFYINYTDIQGNTVVSRFQVSGDPDVANPGSEKKILLVEQPYSNHNGGVLAFGPDGYLYIGLGDGGEYDQGQEQNPHTLLGSILRIDVNVAEDEEAYQIPPDNPFVDGASGRPEVWAVGLRNPWRMSFDRLTGDLYIADVGENDWEEINFLPAGISGGANFGWAYFEGLHPFFGAPPEDLVFTTPIHEYHHEEGGCSVVGGHVYRGAALPTLYGVYIYGDFCSGKIWGLLQVADGSWQNTLYYDLRGVITSFGEDAQGVLYALTLDGVIYRLSVK